MVSKQAGLPASYVPPNLVSLPPETVFSDNQQLRQEAAEALKAMLNDASKLGFDIRVRSAYRSYEEQDAAYRYWVSVLGEEQANRQSARPGHSEHQLGTTVDLTSASVNFQLSQAFGDTAEGRWLQENSFRYGFVLSYPVGKEHITGYIYEPWHFRYIGRDMARAQANSGLTLAEFLACLA